MTIEEKGEWLDYHEEMIGEMTSKEIERALCTARG